MADLMEIETAAPPGANAWIGITKSVTDVAAAETADDRIENWINLDGSEGKGEREAITALLSVERLSHVALPCNLAQNTRSSRRLRFVGWR